MPFIPLEVYANQASTTVTAGGTTAPAGGTVETWTVASSAAFPVIDYGATQFHVADPAVPSEIVTVQAVAGTAWTVARGAETTTPVAHSAGFTVVQVVTAGALAAAQSPPWQFSAQAYGAQGDGKIGTGGTGTSGTSTFTDAGASFVNAAAPAGDVGKVIIINQGTGSATVRTDPFVGTIAAVGSATSVTLSGNLAANCANAPYVYGTDDAAAITSAVNAAAAWAKSTGNYKAQVVFEPCLYTLGALTRQTSPVSYNTHIPVPFADQYDRRLTIDFLGTGDAAEPMYWGGVVPNLQGTCLVSAVWTASQPDATYGQMSVIGTPSTANGLGTGGFPGVNFADVLVNVEGITVVCPYNSEQYGFDFRYATQASVDASAAIAFAPVNYAARPCGGTWLRLETVPLNGVAVGLAMPRSGNNDNLHIGSYSAEGFAVGMMFGEHLEASRIATIYCGTGIGPYSVGNIWHGATIRYWSCEGCPTGMATDGGGGVFPLSIMCADFEAMGYVYVNDAGNCLYGRMRWTALPWSPDADAGFIGTENLTIENLRMKPGVWAADAYPQIPAPPAAPASGVAQKNTAFRPAVVYAAASTSITAFAVGPASGSLVSVSAAAGAGVVVPVSVPSGWWYSVTYTGSLTTKWVLS